MLKPRISTPDDLGGLRPRCRRAKDENVHPTPRRPTAFFQADTIEELAAKIARAMSSSGSAVSPKTRWAVEFLCREGADPEFARGRAPCYKPTRALYAARSIQGGRFLRRTGSTGELSRVCRASPFPALAGGESRGGGNHMVGAERCS